MSFSFKMEAYDWSVSTVSRIRTPQNWWQRWDIMYKMYIDLLFYLFLFSLLFLFFSIFIPPVKKRGKGKGARAPCAPLHPLLICLSTFSAFGKHFLICYK